MQIYNVTREHTVASKVRQARGFFSQLVGLIGRREFSEGEGLWLPLCNSVHTFFLRFPVDVLFVDSKLQVVGIVQNLKPWRTTSIFMKARYTLELPAGTLAKTETQIGDQLKKENG